MKLALLFVFAATIAACTVDTTPKTPDTQGSPSEERSAPKSDDPSSTPSNTPSNVPADVIGQWTWVTSAGAETFTFNADGSYANDVFVDGHPGDGCGTEYFTHRAGVATFTDTTVALRPSEARRKKMDSCSDQTISDDAIDLENDSFSWRRETDERGLPVLVLARAGEGETTFAAGGR